MSISRVLAASATLCVAALATIGCAKKSDHPECPPIKVQLSQGWTRQTAKYGPETLLIPSKASHQLIPLDEKSVGERWGDEHWMMFYKFDTVETSRPVESGPYVYDLKVCSAEIGGRQATVTTLNATGSSLTGALAQAEWALPHGHSFFMSIVAPPGTSRDSMVAILHGVQFTDK